MRLRRRTKKSTGSDETLVSIFRKIFKDKNAEEIKEVEGITFEQIKSKNKR